MVGEVFTRQVKAAASRHRRVRVSLSSSADSIVLIMALHCYRAAFSAIFVLLPAVCYGWGLCNDNDVSCANWAKAGECEKAPHIKKLCPHSCGACDHLCKDLDQSCLGWADSGECDENPDFMIKHCPVTCGQCKVKCYDTDAACSSWARDGEQEEPLAVSLCPVSCGVCTDLCLDKKADCPQWAAAGDCGSNEGYMLKECPRSCAVCTAEHHKKSSHPVLDGSLTQTTACADVDRKQCIVWGEQLCDSNPGAMLRDCPHTCGVCTLACEDKYSDCPNWKTGGRCDEDAPFMRVNCPQSCGVCREMEPPPPKGKDEM